MARTKFCKSFFVLILMFAAASAGAQSFLPGDCVNAGGFCDASNTCIRYDPKDGFLIEVTIGVCDTPIDILGSIDAPQPIPPPTLPHVVFVNNSRNGDFVVSSNDFTTDPQKRTEGTKTLKVKVFPKEKMAMLTISRPLGKAGSATFDRGMTTITVKNGDTITIHGGQTSDVKRNMRISAKIDGKDVLGEFDFTVFHVEITGIITGTADQALPPKVLANSGKPATYRNGITVRPRSMRDAFRDAVQLDSAGNVVNGYPDGKADMHNGTDFDLLGKKFIKEVLAYGGIVMKGRIVPEGIPQYDFSRKLMLGELDATKRESFNFRRIRNIREYTYVGANSGGLLGDPSCEDNTNADDDTTDADEDLIPKNGAIWTYDSPLVIAPRIDKRPQTGSTRSTFVRAQPVPPVPLPPSQGNGPGDGSSVRGIYIFKDWVEYGGIRVSEDLNWSWRFTFINPPGQDPVTHQDRTFEEDTTRGSNDNKVSVTAQPEAVPSCDDSDPSSATGTPRSGRPPVVRPLTPKPVPRGGRVTPQP